MFKLLSLRGAALIGQRCMSVVPRTGFSGPGMARFSGFGISAAPVPPKMAGAAPLNIQIQWPQAQEAEEADNTIYADSVLRKRRLKMKKHKLRKRRRAQRALKKRLGKL